jgi:prepilin peptidase CpaA
MGHSGANDLHAGGPGRRRRRLLLIDFTTNSFFMKTTYVVALALAFAASVTDLRNGRIPNVLTFGGALAAIIFHGFRGGGAGLLMACGGWIAGAAVFFPVFVLGGMGAGDAKLLAALGAWLGPADALWLALYSGIAGGVLALSLALASGYLRQAMANIRLLLMHWRVSGIGTLHQVSLAGSKGPRLAYAVPILVGTVATIWLH